MSAKVGLASFAVGLLVLAMAMAAIPLNGSEFWLIWGAVGVTIPFISLTIASIWVEQVWAKCVDADRGITRLRFRSADYRQAGVQGLQDQIGGVDERGLVDPETAQLRPANPS